MNEKSRTRRDFIQNISIAVLTVSAVLLFVQTQIYNLGASNTFFRIFSGPDAQTSAVISYQKDDFTLSAPLRVAVTGTYGRYGDVSMTSADEEFLPLRHLLEQALGSTQSLTFSSKQLFLSALSYTSVYYDFLSPLPLCILADLAQTSNSENTVSVRHVVIAEEEGTVSLYLWDGADHYYRGSTSLSPEDLNKFVSQYELGNAFFGFESTESHAPTTAPFSLFLAEEPALPVLSANFPLSDTALLLASLRFNPNTQNRYWESDGTEVISENSGRTLRIHSDGTVTYQSGDDPALSIQAENESPTLVEAAGEVGIMLNNLLSLSSGTANVYLEDIQQNGASTTLRFGYQVGGVPIRFADGQSAAHVTLSGRTVSSMTLRFRQYTLTENDSLLLPLRQALAIAAAEPGTELSIGYTDSGSDTVRAAWLAD